MSDSTEISEGVIDCTYDRETQGCKVKVNRSRLAAAGFQPMARYNGTVRLTGRDEIELTRAHKIGQSRTLRNDLDRLIAQDMARALALVLTLMHSDRKGAA